MTTTPSPFFQLLSTKRARSRVKEQLQNERAAQKEETRLRVQALLYLDDFLRSSPWHAQMDQITIVHDAVPTMPVLNSYGGLDEQEGTRACRRLFKAVVVWDQLGHSLWKTLRAASEQRQLAQQRYAQAAALDGCASDQEFHLAVSRLSARRSSEASVDSARSQDSAHSSVGETTKKQQQPPLLKLSKKLSSSSSRRSSSESSASGLEQRCSACGTNQRRRSRSPIPKVNLQNCASAVRRTLSVFGESRTSLSLGRQQSR
ncbi:Uncharacterized protein TPAR_05965 [Tolypocladium paradoxum]|uniref:Uncharacterized protein n=1 Tax=Tolypocladium paradoxum TaxID=94208 RepID=A0A2S4KUG9_9HYPO|nr:Uncharacterized protein TPAR_05965 [Tolypocladium paradoxum]